jgi:hypothetical protein
MKQLMNHCGATAVQRENLSDLGEPKPMSVTHCPISHEYFVSEVEAAMGDAGYEIKDREFSLQRRLDKKTGEMTCDNLFGLMELQNCDNHEDIGKIVGLRNSSTMHFKAQLGVGGRVFVCDNLCFSADVVVGRRHTQHIKRDLPKLLNGAIFSIKKEFIKNELRVDIYKDTNLDRQEVHDIAMVSMRAGAIPASALKPWINTYHNPTHEEFRRQDCWALQNAFTEVAKKWPFRLMQERTQKLVKVIDRMINIDDKLEVTA